MSEKTCYNCGQVSTTIQNPYHIIFGILNHLSLPHTKGGHLARDCKNPRAEGDARDKINSEKRQYRRCFNCGKFGHIADDCTKPRNEKACYNCGKVRNVVLLHNIILLHVIFWILNHSSPPCLYEIKDGHIARDCPEPRAPRDKK